MDVSVDTARVLPDWKPGPFDLYPVEDHGMDELDLDMTDEEWTLFNLASDAVERLETEGDA